MQPGESDLLSILVTAIVPFAVVLILTPKFASLLKRRNMLAKDVHKNDGRMVPSPAGPLLICALVLGEIIAFVFYGSIIPLVMIGVILIAGLIGLLDDVRSLSGELKPTLLIFAALPMLLGQRIYPELYNPRLYFPLFTSTGTHFIIFGILILASIPVVSNAFNMMDAFNGEISGFTLITSVALIVAIILRATVLQNYSSVRLAVALPLVSVSLAFFFYNRYPSRIFDGDSGSLTFGAMYAALAFIGGVEFAALVAIIPAVMNSFYIISSVKRIVERRRMAVRPTFLRGDGMLQATDKTGAPMTLARMILLDGPLSEQQIVNRVFVLTIFSSLLAVLTAVFTWLIRV
ncbi:MAG: UDP-N-acetylglucosamine-1-phosphate transferase [Thaumarchaeota archaeon]|nr:UDP-N-acetylglucosamine-1-phosphate transferase [Nitrososphaerota archaeon]